MSDREPPGAGEHDPARAFEGLAGQLDYPMFVVTAAADAERAGCLVGFATQTSIDPPRFLVCISRRNRTFRVAARALVLAVHFVPADQAALAELFGGSTGDEMDKFARCRWHPGPHGVPIIEACANWFAGTVERRLDLGDHAGFLLAPVAAHRGDRAGTFNFHRARRIEPGHEA